MGQTHLLKLYYQPFHFSTPSLVKVIHVTVSGPGIIIDCLDEQLGFL